MTDYGEELDDVIDEARERLAASRATTEADYARIRDFQHMQVVLWEPRSHEYVEWREHGIA